MSDKTETTGCSTTTTGWTFYDRHRCTQCHRTIDTRGWRSHKKACDRRLAEWRKWCQR